MFPQAVRGLPSIAARRQRHKFLDGRITRRRRNPRLHQSKWRKQRCPASFQQSSEDSSQEPQNISDYVMPPSPLGDAGELGDRSDSSGYRTLYTPGSSTPIPPPSSPDLNRANDEATSFLESLKELFKRQSRSDLTVIQKRGDLTVYEKDIRYIVEDFWFTDNIIDYYLQLIVDRCMRLDSELKVVAVSAVATRKAVRASTSLPADIVGARLVFLPFRYADHTKHPWSLVVVEMATMTIINFNPTGQEESYKADLEKALDATFESIVSTWTHIDARAPENVEPPSISGLQVCNFADGFSKHPEQVYRGERLSFFILQFLYEICQNIAQPADQKLNCVKTMSEFVKKFLESRSPPPRDVIRSKDGVTLLKEDMLLLDGENWLNDHVVDMYFLLIKDRADKRLIIGERRSPRVEVIASVLSPFLINYNESQMEAAFRPDLQFDILFFPVSWHDHWILLVVVKAERTVYYLDSRWRYSASVDPPDFVANILKPPLLSGYTVKVRRTIPCQMNGFDCGVYVCRYARYLVEGVTLKEDTFTDDDMKRIREFMKNELTSGILTDLPRGPGWIAGACCTPF